MQVVKTRGGVPGRGARFALKTHLDLELTWKVGRSWHLIKFQSNDCRWALLFKPGTGRARIPAKQQEKKKPPTSPQRAPLPPSPPATHLTSMAPVAMYQDLDPKGFATISVHKGAFGMQIIDLAYMKNGMGNKVYVQTPYFKRVLITSNEANPDKINCGFSLRDEPDFQGWMTGVEDQVKAQLAAKYPEIKIADFSSRISISDRYPPLFNANITKGHNGEGVRVYNFECEEKELKDFEALAKAGGLQARALIEFGFVWVKAGRAGVSASVRMIQYKEQEKLDGFAFLD